MQIRIQAGSQTQSSQLVIYIPETTIIWWDPENGVGLMQRQNQSNILLGRIFKDQVFRKFI